MSFCKETIPLQGVALDFSQMELTVLVALVSRYGRLILPDLGAFLVSDFESGYSVANVTFSPFLRYNDGKFEQYLESDYAQTKAQARQSVQLFVSEIRQTLEQNGHCTIPDLGELRRDTQGQISFFPQGGDQAPAPQTEGTAVAPPVADERPAFDIPLIDEVVVAPPLPDGEYTISDGQFGATTLTTLESPSAAPSIHEEGAFSLDGAIVEVNQYAASTLDTLSPLEIHLVEEEEAAQGGDALVTLEPSAQESGFPVDDCISAYQAYQAAAVPPPIEPSIESSVEYVEEVAPLAPDPSETTLGEEASGEEPVSLQMEATPLEVEAQEASKEEAPQEAQVDSQENSQEVAKEDSQAAVSPQAPLVKPSRAGRTTPRAGAKETPWVASHTVVRKERSYKGVMWTAIAIVFLSLVVIDWLWLQQVTPRVVALLEEQGVLLRQHPSVDVSPQDAAKLASVNPQAPSQVPPVTPPSANTTVGELEKEWQRRVANGEGSVPTQTATPQATHTQPTSTAAPTPSDNHRANTVEATAPAMPPTTASAFHVVLGCFRDVDNADAYAKKLKRSGFQTRVLAQNTGMHAVVVGSYTTRREASLVLNDIRGRYPEAWVLEK